MLRGRIIAFCVLICCMGIPGILYWYFFHKHISYIHLQLSEYTDARVTLKGSLKMKYLPLADMLLSYEYTCQEDCKIGPLPPAEYALNITQDDSIPLTDGVSLGIGETLKKTYTRIPKLRVTQVDLPQYSDTLKDVLMNRIQDDTSDQAQFIGWRDSTHIYVRKKEEQGGETLLLVGTNGSIPLKMMNPAPQEIRLDETGQYFMMTYSSGVIHILPRDFSQEYIVRTSESIRSVSLEGQTLKIRTSDTIYSLDGDTLVSNPRFTDYIDIDSQYRIGYIDHDDTQKLSLSNFPQGKGVLMLIDRHSGTTKLLDPNIDLDLLLFSEGIPSYTLSDGTIWNIDTSTFLNLGS